jgi:hypothetical protein
MGAKLVRLRRSWPAVPDGASGRVWGSSRYRDAVLREGDEHPRTPQEVNQALLGLAARQGTLDDELGRWLLLAHQPGSIATLGWSPSPNT